MTRINAEFSKQLSKYGAFDLNACYNCGNCTAVCNLTDENSSFPRKMVRLSVLGLEDDLKSSLEPWLCYYCGECTTTCPREADPGELMMSLRRWLTSKYDWTGLSGLLYRSLTTSVAAFLFLAVVVLGGAYYAKLDTAKIMHFGHQFEVAAISLVFSVILLPNIIRMWWLTVFKTSGSITFAAYFKSLGELVIHMFTQKRALGCDDNKFRWFEHFILVIGYLSLLFTTVFLDWFGTGNLFVIILGYVESAVIFIVTSDFVRRRLAKDITVSKNSQPSDWLFVIWLLLMGLTAFAVRVFIDTGLLETNIWIYLIHLIVLVQWALIIVPFGKWTHFLYRSFAVYFDKVLSFR